MPKFYRIISQKGNSGQTLIEIILTLAIVVIVISGITLAITSALKNATFSKNQNLASFYAQQGMEIVRQIRDRGWTTFSLISGFNCLSQGSQQLVARVGPDCEGPGEGEIFVEGTKFIRQIRLQTNSGDCDGNVPGTPNTKVTVQVLWSDSICRDPSNYYCHESILVSCFLNTNVIPTP